jgi:hypothetical protein
MKRPFFHFRPENDTRATDGTDPIDWEDNWLSNGLAAASFYLTPKACQTPEHFTSRWTNYLFTTCPCCSYFRGVVTAAVPLLFIIAVLVVVLLVR